MAHNAEVRDDDRRVHVLAVAVRNPALAVARVIQALLPVRHKHEIALAGAELPESEAPPVVGRELADVIDHAVDDREARIGTPGELLAAGERELDGFGESARNGHEPTSQQVGSTGPER